MERERWGKEQKKNGSERRRERERKRGRVGARARARERGGERQRESEREREKGPTSESVDENRKVKKIRGKSKISDNWTFRSLLVLNHQK